MKVNKSKYEVFSDIFGNFESLQFSIILFLGFQIKDRDLAHIIFDDMAFSRMIKLFKPISHHTLKKPEILAEIDEICKQLNTANEYRNEVAHSGMGLEFDENNQLVSKNIVSKGKELNEEILNGYDLHIRKLTERIFQLMEKLGYLKNFIIKRSANSSVD